MTEQLGPAAAAALMECIPPYGWHEIATKSDLAALEERLERYMELRLAATFHAEMNRMIRWTVGSIFGGMAAITGAAVALAALLG